jgi:hypothetical protein
MALPASHGVPTTSPFTHAPLSQPARGALAHDLSTPMPTSAQENAPPYTHYQYQYPPSAAFPGFGLPGPPPVSKGDSSVEQQPVAAVSNTATVQAASSEGNAVNEEVGEGSDAWEAAQAILKAINFGSILQATTAKQPGPPPFQPSPPTNSVHAGPASGRALASDVMNGAGVAASPVQELSDRDRASLQAQLALLAAQLAEIAEDTLANDLNVTDEDADTEGGHGSAGEDDMEVVEIPQQRAGGGV